MAGLICFGRSVGIAAVLVSAAAQGQGTGLGTVVGSVRDPSGATVPDAKLTLQPVGTGAGVELATSGRAGRFSVQGKPGKYVLMVTAEGFATATSAPFTLTADATTSVDVKLKIEEQMQQVDVTPDNAMDTDPSQNGDQLTLKGKDISQLPLESAQLLQELQGLAGGNSPEIYLNGFSGGTLPPRDTIREIRINQNPYSAQNDTNPVNGRIEVLTKPGTEKFHGDLNGFGNTSGLNARNPFITQQSSYYSDGFYAGLNGPLGKKTGFQINFNTYNSQANTAVNAQIVDAGLNAVGFSTAVPTPTTYINFSARVDKSIGTKSTVSAQYSVNRNGTTNGGVGQLSLPEQGYNSTTTVQTLQLSNSQILSAKVVNDTRFQYVRSRVHQTPDLTTPAVSVQGSFVGGGNNGGSYHDNQDRYELQNYVSAALKTHYLNFGGRLRATRDANQSNANYNGQYTFTDLPTYQLTLASKPGGGALQYTQTVGNPGVAVKVVDGALYFQDDWKVRKNVTISPGLRFETQDDIGDHADFAPRLGVSYSFDQAKDKPPAFVLRGGVGLFYRRFTSGYVLQAARQNGITQQQYVVSSPTFFTPGSPLTAAALAAMGSQTSSSIYQISPQFHAPYIMSATVSLQRQLGTHGSVTATYLESRGVHDQLTRNINAPLPGTYVQGVSPGTRPLGGTQNIYEYESGGVDRNHRLTINTNLRVGQKVYIFGNYAYQFARTDTNGGFPSNQYNLGQDYGRASNDIRHALNIGGNAQLPFGFNTFAYLRATSSPPFNITTGQDFNGDTQFNDRPSFATDPSRKSVIQTPYGLLDLAPIAGQTIIPINYGNAPGYVALNIELGKGFDFGPVVKDPPGTPVPKLKPGQKPEVNRKFYIHFGISAENAFNHVNYTAPVGVLSSPQFGKLLGIANGNGASNRDVEFSTYFHF